LCRCQCEAAHRYRCAACRQTFCDACRTRPYHTGLTCAEAAAPHCLLCDALMLEAAGELQAAGLSSKALRAAAADLGMDCRHCLERAELVALYRRAKQVCARWHACSDTPSRAVWCLQLLRRACLQEHAPHAHA
jgi:hypothetical protein